MSSASASSSKEMILKPMLVGVIAGVGSGVLLGNGGQLSILGMTVSPAVAIGTAVGVGSLTASAFNQYVLPKIATNEQLRQVESGALGLVVPGVSAVLVSHFLIGSLASTSAMLQLGALGAGAEMAGSYAWPMVAPMVGA